MQNDENHNSRSNNGNGPSGATKIRTTTTNNNNEIQNKHNTIIAEATKFRLDFHRLHCHHGGERWQTEVTSNKYPRCVDMVRQTGFCLVVFVALKLTTCRPRAGWSRRGTGSSARTSGWRGRRIGRYSWATVGRSARGKTAGGSTCGRTASGSTFGRAAGGSTWGRTTGSTGGSTCGRTAGGSTWGRTTGSTGGSTCGRTAGGSTCTASGSTGGRTTGRSTCGRTAGGSTWGRTAAFTCTARWATSGRSAGRSSCGWTAGGSTSGRTAGRSRRWTAGTRASTGPRSGWGTHRRCRRLWCWNCNSSRYALLNNKVASEKMLTNGSDVQYASLSRDSCPYPLVENYGYSLHIELQQNQMVTITA